MGQSMIHPVSVVVSVSEVGLTDAGVAVTSAVKDPNPSLLTRSKIPAVQIGPQLMTTLRQVISAVGHSPREGRGAGQGPARRLIALLRHRFAQDRLVHRKDVA